MPNPFNQETRNQVLLERLKAGASREFRRVVGALNTGITRILGREGEFLTSKKQMASVRADIRDLVGDRISGHYSSSLNPLLEELAVEQANFERKVIDLSNDKVAKKDLIAHYTNASMSLDGSKKLLINPFLSEFNATSQSTVGNVVTRGYAQRTPTAKILTDIRGRASHRFMDGAFAKVARGYTNAASTAIQHVATASRHRIMSIHPDIDKYRWISVLDSRTSPVCRGLSGREFIIGQGPLPPIHWGCRSSTMIVRGEAPPDQTYYSWLKDQPSDFQDTAIGPSRGKLLREGGLDSEEFARLSLNTTFEPLTLAEMKAKSPQVFTKAKLVI